MRAKSPRQRLKRIEALLRDLDGADERDLRRLLPRVKRELKEYKSLLEMLWVWSYR